MNHSFLIETLRSIVAASVPLIYAGIGETLTERAGVVNLSLDGSILLAAMTGFAVAYLTGWLWLALLAAMVVGALVAGLVAYANIELRQNQVAIGLTLTLLCADLSSFLGKPFMHQPGPGVAPRPLPVLSAIPGVGPILFDQNALAYGSYLLLIGAWIWVSRTQAGLNLRAVGERPEAAFARGIDVNRLRYLYTLIGGALVGLAGASYSLSVKLGWSHRHTAGVGWIALAIVIFGGWHPLRVAFGAYLFGALRALGGILQPIFPTVPTQIFQAAPFALMVMVLLLVGIDAGRIEIYFPRWLRPLYRGLLGGSPPAALGQRFDKP
ncbi:MAG: ABC transporter permease [Chloroflexi bacterium]|nr:ABC transporter permease [Chloroflexota bacterium]